MSWLSKAGFLPTVSDSKVHVPTPKKQPAKCPVGAPWSLQSSACSLLPPPLLSLLAILSFPNFPTVALLLLLSAAAHAAYKSGLKALSTLWPRQVAWSCWEDHWRPLC